MNASFFLRKHSNLQPIIVLSVSDGRLPGRRVKISTGISIDHQDWDKRKNRLKLTQTRAETNLAINQYLDSLVKTVIEFSSKKYGAHAISAIELRTIVKPFTSTRQLEADSTEMHDQDFFKLWKHLIETTKTSTGLPITSSSIQTKMQTLRLVKKFAIARCIDINLLSMNMNFYHLFDEYLVAKGYSLNTRGKHFKEIKAMLREAMDRDYTVNLSFQKKKFKVIRSDSESTYLSIDEIKAILLIELPTALQPHRDLFVMACFVGARYGDWRQIIPENIVKSNGRELLIIRQQKTRELIHIPVHPVVRMILDKYQGNAPKPISNQKMNKYIKQICQQANLGRILINGQIEDKWRMISTHTARRSFATNAYLSKSMEVYQIMKCTGHKTESSFLKYLKLNGKDFAIQAADSDFFTNKSWLQISKAS